MTRMISRILGLFIRKNTLAGVLLFLVAKYLLAHLDIFWDCSFHHFITNKADDVQHCQYSSNFLSAFASCPFVVTECLQTSTPGDQADDVQDAVAFRTEFSLRWVDVVDDIVAE
ncbi:hypothetical protein DL98DRAFT_584920 [Cadophora sp. DSE1049]|nr:hypothetical protein DL98DRAFT_584920 [Cadophora sp. DSE1049]